MFRVKALVKE